MKKSVRILQIAVTVLLLLCLTVSVLYAAVLGTIRTLYTPAYVENLLTTLDYARVQVPDGYGSFDTLCHLVNAQFEGFGIRFTEEDFNTLLRTLSIDTVVTDFAESVRAWLLEEGPAPTLDPRAIAETMVGGLPESMQGFLGLFGNPADPLTSLLASIFGHVDFATMFREAEPVRAFLSEGAFWFAVSVCAGLLVLLWLVQGVHLLPALTLSGLAGAAAGGILLTGPSWMTPFKNRMLVVSGMPEATFDIVYLPLTERLGQTGVQVALGGAAVLAVFGILLLLHRMVVREKKKAAERTAA